MLYCFFLSFFFLFCLFIISQKGRVFKKRLSSQLVTVVTSCQHFPALQYEKNTIPSGQARALNDLRLGANYYDKFCHHGTLLNDYENIVGSSHYVRYKS